MSPPDLLDDERHKSKLKHREEVCQSLLSVVVFVHIRCHFTSASLLQNVKLSPRLKFKRDRVTKNSDSKTADSSTFQRCKKLISFSEYCVTNYSNAW